MVNLLTQTPGVSHLAKLFSGMPLQRQIPEFAPQTFRDWFQKRQRSAANGAEKVILWADTFNNYFFPETARAALEVLESAGCDVEVPQGHLCCGRPLYDYGFLDMAKEYLRRILRNLEPDINAGVPVVVLEPSCASVFRDELHGLFPNDPLAKKLREQTFLLSEFLEKKVPHWQPPQHSRQALVQGHCHHKSVLRFDDESSVLTKLGLDHKLLPSGCCGMAGSFGFENDKYEISREIGERVLLPAVRRAAPETLIIADGFSCREQIAQDTERQALHLAQAIRLAHSEGSTQPGKYVESQIVERGKKWRRRARIRALFALVGTVCAAVLLGKLARKI